MFQKPSRPVDRVFIHCSASDNPNHDAIRVIREWHLARGFSDVGYHFFIRKDGTIETGRSIEKSPAAQKGHNKSTIAICLHGLDNFTAIQFDSLKELCEAIDHEYQYITFHGHFEVNPNKTCPNFNVNFKLRLTPEGQWQKNIS
jgi:hypothetical protein